MGEKGTRRERKSMEEQGAYDGGFSVCEGQGREGEREGCADVW